MNSKKNSEKYSTQALSMNKKYGRYCMAILSPGSYVFVPTTKIKSQNKLSKLPSWDFIFLTTPYLSTCLGIYDVQITGNCICKSKKKKKKKNLPTFLSSPPDRRKSLSPFQAAFF